MTKQTYEEFRQDTKKKALDKIRGSEGPFYNTVVTFDAVTASLDISVVTNPDGARVLDRANKVGLTDELVQLVENNFHSLPSVKQAADEVAKLKKEANHAKT